MSDTNSPTGAKRNSASACSLDACLVSSETALLLVVTWRNVIRSVTLMSSPYSKCNRYVLSNPVATFLGRISYSLYLFHSPVLPLVCVL